MKVLAACEFSGRVRDAFNMRGHNTYSIDLLPGEGWMKDYKHMIGYVQRLFDDPFKMVDGTYSNEWDMMIAFPPCTHLAVSGARWFKEKQQEQKDAIKFVEWLWTLPIKKIAIENPIGVLSTKSRLGKPSQIIQPWQFGHGETKSTCLWLKNLPKLVPTNVVSGREGRVWKEPPGPDRWKKRSITYQGIANAMAEQWG